MSAVSKASKKSQFYYTDYELQLAKAKLFAMVAKADGQVLEIEDMVSGSLIDHFDSDSENHLKHLYQKISLGIKEDDTVEEVAEILKHASLPEKLALIRMISSIASCDGYVHASEIDIIKKMMSLLKVQTSILEAD